MGKFSVFVVFCCAFLQILVSAHVSEEIGKDDELKSENAVQKFNIEFSENVFGSNEFEDNDINESDLDVKEILSINYPKLKIRKRSVYNALIDSTATNDPTTESNATDLQEQISKITLVIYKVRKQINKIVADYALAIELSISETEESLKKELEELQIFSYQTKSEASEDGTDIQACFRYTNRINITGIFSKCNPGPLSFVESQKIALDEAEKAFIDDVNACETQCDGTESDQCVQEATQNTKMVVFKIIKAIDTLLSMDNANRFNCIETIFRKLDDSLSKAAYDFNACVEDIFDTDV